MRLTALCLSLLCSVAFCQQTPPAGWSATAPMLEARDSSCAVHLTDGRILVTGGVGVGGDLASTEFYLPQGSFISGPTMNSTRSSHTCTLLNDGRVLVAGGDTDGTGSAEIFDPLANQWQFVAGTGEARRGHTATLLPDGQVFLAGGDGGNGPLRSIAIFDPGSNSMISSDPALLEARSQHAAVLLADGRVMLVGGQGATAPLSSTEIFDPRDFSLVAGPKLSTPRAGHSAVRMDDGRVLAAGGFDGNKETDTAEILGPAGDAWMTLEAHLNTARRDHLAILIPGNGGVLIAGGLQDGQPLGSTELFLPVESTFLALGPLTLARSRVAVAPIDAGLILAAGGRTGDGPQSACGVLQVPAIRFAKPLYHIPETVTAVLSSVPVSVKVNFSLSVAPGSSIAAANDRLLTPSVTLSAGSTQSVPIMLTRLDDAGLTARLTATAAGTITAVATTQIHNATSVTLSLPQATYEGLNATLLALLSRGPSIGTMTGTLNMNVSNVLSSLLPSISDGTSNTIIIGENTGTTTTVINTTSSAATVQRPLTSLATGTYQVSANYSGDVADDPASASGSFLVVSRTPRVQLSTSVATAVAGVPFSVSATVQTNGTVPNPQPFTGSISLLQSGFPVLGATGLSTGGSLFSSASITPLTLNPFSLSATYSGDSFFRNASSLTTTVNVQKATPTLTIDTAPATYTCGQASNFAMTLSYPVALGLTNHSVNLEVLASDGSVRGITPLSSSGLTVTPPGAKDISAKATATISAVLPLDISGVLATFGGDTLLNGANSATVNPTLQLSTVGVVIKTLPTVTNPATFNALVSSPSCSAPPTGTVEFLDGAASLGVVPLPAPQILPFIEQGFASPGESSASLSVSRPPGVHNISVRYSGDRHYQPATSAAVPITFQ